MKRRYNKTSYTKKPKVVYVAMLGVFLLASLVYYITTPEKEEESRKTMEKISTIDKKERIGAQDIVLKPNGWYSGTVIRVVDGDTIEVQLKNGESKTKEKIRLIGVDTPETKHPKKAVEYYGVEASNFTKSNLADKNIWLQLDVGARDRYQRILAYVWIEKPKDESSEKEIRTKMFNAHLILEGYGKVVTIQPNSRYSELFVKFQREARKNGMGLWNETKK